MVRRISISNDTELAKMKWNRAVCCARINKHAMCLNEQAYGSSRRRVYRFYLLRILYIYIYIYVLRIFGLRARAHTSLRHALWHGLIHNMLMISGAPRTARSVAVFWRISGSCTYVIRHVCTPHSLRHASWHGLAHNMCMISGAPRTARVRV
jgi:hypothetical protein